MTKNDKRVYIWKLATFLVDHGMRMSGDELAEHLNRNNIQTDYGSEYAGKRGVYRFVTSVYKWLYDELDLKAEAQKVAEAFVQPDGKYAYQVGAEAGEA